MLLVSIRVLSSASPTYGDYISACAVAANLLVAFLMLNLSALTDTKWTRKNYKHPHIDVFEANVDKNAGSVSEQYG